MTRHILAALSLLAFATTAAAQSADQSARLDMLQAQIEALQKQVEALKADAAKAAPQWKGAPQWAGEDGFSFKPRGRLQLDSGYIGIPDGYAANRNLGFNSRVRRFNLGAEGTLPGGFGYKVETEFANASVAFEDVYLTYAPKGAAWGLKLGNQEVLPSLEQMTSSSHVSFMERAQMNDAFNASRRLGLVLGVHDKADTLRLDIGLFTAHSIDGSFDNDGWISSARAVYAPMVGGGRLHFGVNAQHRDFQSNDNGVASTSNGAPSTNQLARYRARPFLQNTDVRFVDTGSFAAHGDNLLGLEFAGIFKSLHFASEAQWVRVNAYRAGGIATGLDAFAGGSAVTPTSDPTFFSGYAELGYFLTGETRSYREGSWNRPKLAHPFNKGGWGAVQVVGRVDYVDLDSGALKNGATNNFATGVSSLAAANSRLARGGKQTGYLFGINWWPADYLRFIVNYIHTEVEGGPLAATAKPLSTAPVDQRKYSTDAVAVRAQVEF